MKYVNICISAVSLLFSLVVSSGVATAAPQKSNKKLKFRIEVLDPDTGADTVPLGISKNGELLLKLSTEASTRYLLRSRTGSLTDLSAQYPGLSFLDISASGLLLSGPKNRADGACVVYTGDVATATAGTPLTEVVLQGTAFCSGSVGRIASTNLFAVLLESPSQSAPRPMDLLVFSQGVAYLRPFSGDSPGNLDSLEVLAGFRSGGVVTNFVEGSTTPRYTSVVFGRSGTEEIKFPSGGPSVVGFLIIKSFINNDAILTTNDFSGCGAYVVRAERNAITDIKRILRKGTCVVASSINAHARAVGCAFTITSNSSTCEPFYWDRETRFNSLPIADRILAGASWKSVNGINARNQIVGVVETSDGRSRSVLLSPK